MPLLAVYQNTNTQRLKALPLDAGDWHDAIFEADDAILEHLWHEADPCFAWSCICVVSEDAFDRLEDFAELRREMASSYPR
jgi:hypothetical protein